MRIHFAPTFGVSQKWLPRSLYKAQNKPLRSITSFSPTITGLTTELRTYLVEGAYATGNLAAAVFESKDWADWAFVPPGR